MSKKDEKMVQIDSISIKHIANLSIVDMVMLQLLQKHEKPVIRHILYNEISQFLTQERKKVAKSIKTNVKAAGAEEFYNWLEEPTRFSSSSLYYSLDQLESKGLVKYNRDENRKVISVEATQYTEILINTILKHVVKFGLIDTEQNKFLPKIIKEVIIDKILSTLDKKNFGTLLYIWFSDLINAKCAKLFSSLSNNLFVLSSLPAFESVQKLGIENIQFTSIFNSTIRESDRFFDGVIIPYHFKSTNFEEVSKEEILKEAFRVVKDNGIVIIHSYTEIPNINHAIFDIFIKWVENIYEELEFYTEERFKQELLKAGAKDADVFVYKGHLFGIGQK
jgi:Fe2+ or Zn2+ uptake regulation protein